MGLTGSRRKFTGRLASIRAIITVRLRMDTERSSRDMLPISLTRVSRYSKCKSSKYHNSYSKFSKFSKYNRCNRFNRSNLASKY